MRLLCSVVYLLEFFQFVFGHGRLREPPSRASMWRDGFPQNGFNYDDNQLYCGGFGVSIQMSLYYKCVAFLMFLIY